MKNKNYSKLSSVFSLIAIVVGVIMSSQSFAQTQLIPANDGGFENATSSFAANGWSTALSGSARNWFVATTANTPVGGSNPGAAFTLRYENTNTSYSSFTLQPSINLTSLAGTTVRIVFTFVNDGVAPVSNAAIDNVSLTYIPGTACSGTPN